MPNYTKVIENNIIFYYRDDVFDSSYFKDNIKQSNSYFTKMMFSDFAIDASVNKIIKGQFPMEKVLDNFLNSGNSITETTFNNIISGE